MQRPDPQHTDTRYAGHRSNPQTIAVGLFDDRSKAQEAIRELKRQGFTDEQIGVAAKHDEGLGEGYDPTEASRAGTGAGAGAVAGLGLGSLWGMGIVAGLLPAIGPAIAGGMLAAIVASAAAGAAAGGIVGALVGLGIPEEDAKYYQSEVERGSILVTVRAPAQLEVACGVLERLGAYNVHSKRDSTNLEYARSDTTSATDMPVDKEHRRG